METLIIKPRNNDELLFLRKFLDLARMNYVISERKKTEKEIMNPSLIKRIDRPRKNIEKNTVSINPDNVWQSIL